MAKPKKITNIDGSEADPKLIVTKRHIDIYRDNNGNLEGIVIKDLEIDNYTFSRLSLIGAAFKNSSFKKCNFKGVDLSLCDIEDCTFENCDFTFAVITKEQNEKNILQACVVRSLNVIG